MAISGTIRLLTASTNLSTFDLYSCTSSSNSSCSGNAFETNISKNDLLNGFPSNLIDDGTQYVKIKSNAGDCINQYIIVQLNGAPALGTTPTPTPTSTPTSTPTPSPVGVAVGGSIALSYGSTGPDACSGSSGTINVYYAASDPHPGELWSGTTYYDSNGFPFDGSGQTYWSDGVNYYGTISSSGYYQQQGTCA
jgi:hypothetical protein